MRGGGVRARAHACVALGRCVAFGRPKMSVWGHAGARSRTPKVACISFLRALFGHEFDVSVSFFPFRSTPSASPVSSTNSLERGGGVRARAHACVALGRCVAFGHRLKGRLRSPRSTQVLSTRSLASSMYSFVIAVTSPSVFQFHNPASA
jgi:hypothetical protein